MASTGTSLSAGSKCLLGCTRRQVNVCVFDNFSFVLQFDLAMINVVVIVDSCKLASGPIQALRILLDGCLRSRKKSLTSAWR
jgi:hypothetical protein